MKRFLWILTTILVFSVVSLSAQGEPIKEITALDWNVDGTKLAIGYSDGTIEIRDFVDGSVLTNSNASSPVKSLSWHPINSDLLVAGISAVFWIWDTRSDQITYVNPGVNSIDSTEWNADGTLIASAIEGLARTFPVQIWDADGMPIINFTTHHRLITQVAWSPIQGDNRLASTSLDGDTILWDVNTETELLRLFNPLGGIGVMWSPDGQEIATLSGDSHVRIWNATTGEHLRTYEGTFVIDMAWSPDGLYLAIIDGEDINILDAISLDIRKTLSVGRVMNRVVWSVNDELAFGGGGNLDVQFYTFEDNND